MLTEAILDVTKKTKKSMNTLEVSKRIRETKELQDRKQLQKWQ